MSYKSKSDIENISDVLEENEYAIIVDNTGRFKGIISSDTSFSDFDQLPMDVANILMLLYGDVFNITHERKIQ